MKRYSQREAVERFLPALDVAGVVYEKFREVEAVEAAGGEHIVTVTSDGKETENTAAPGDFIVTNLSAARERYVVGRETFLGRYERLSEGRWKPVGRALALQVTTDEPFAIEGAWGGSMPVKPGDYLATPLPNRNEVIRIAEREFYETYRLPT